MNRFLAIVLSASILIQSFSFDLGDLVKIPVLLDHISCHFEQGENFSDFITQHYGSLTDEHNDNHKQHKDLPFKHQHLETHFQLVYFISLDNFDVELNETRIKNNNFNYKEPSSELFSDIFFQPPKVV